MRPIGFGATRHQSQRKLDRIGRKKKGFRINNGVNENMKHRAGKKKRRSNKGEKPVGGGANRGGWMRGWFSTVERGDLRGSSCWKVKRQEGPLGSVLKGHRLYWGHAGTLLAVTRNKQRTSQKGKESEPARPILKFGKEENKKKTSPSLQFEKKPGSTGNEWGERILQAPATRGAKKGERKTRSIWI